jgi:pilus assembly protein CpaB
MNAHAPAMKPTEASYAAPSRPMQAGEVLRAEDMEMVAWPAANAIDGAYARAADVVGREVLFPLSKGQPILDQYLSAAGAGTGLAGKIPDGQRAIALRSDEVVGVAGFLVPGSHVDVLVTYRSEQAGEPVTATVLQNAVVIAAGHQVEPDPRGKPEAVAVVTLLLTPEEAERAVLASTQGAIHFVLRNGDDAGRMHDAPMALSELAGGIQVGRAAPERRLVAPNQAPTIPERRGIEVVLGEGTEGDGSQGSTGQEQRGAGESAKQAAARRAAELLRESQSGVPRP